MILNQVPTLRGFLFPHFAEQTDELGNLFLLVCFASRSKSIFHAMIGVYLQYLHVSGLERGHHCRNLLKDIKVIAAFFDHFGNATRLSFDAACSGDLFGERFCYIFLMAKFCERAIKTRSWVGLDSLALIYYTPLGYDIHPIERS